MLHVRRWRDARPTGRVRCWLAPCREPKTGQQKVQRYYEDDPLCPSSYITVFINDLTTPYYIKQQLLNSIQMCCHRSCSCCPSRCWCCPQLLKLQLPHLCCRFPPPVGTADWRCRQFGGFLSDLDCCYYTPEMMSSPATNIFKKSFFCSFLTFLQYQM